jgi:hypothetical protein
MSLPPDCNPGQEYRMGGAAPKEIPAEGTLVRASRSARTRSRPFGARPLATMAAFFIRAPAGWSPEPFSRRCQFILRSFRLRAARPLLAATGCPHI